MRIPSQEPARGGSRSTTGSRRGPMPEQRRGALQHRARSTTSLASRQGFGAGAQRRRASAWITPVENLAHAGQGRWKILRNRSCRTLGVRPTTEGISCKSSEYPSSFRRSTAAHYLRECLDSPASLRRFQPGKSSSLTTVRRTIRRHRSPATVNDCATCEGERRQAECGQHGALPRSQATWSGSSTMTTSLWRMQSRRLATLTARPAPISCTPATTSAPTEIRGGSGQRKSHVPPQPTADEFFLR